MPKKQRLEGDFSKVARATAGLWSIKLQVHPLSFQKSPADFMVLGLQYRNLVECKECRQGVFEFARMTQREMMEYFVSVHPFNRAYVLICMWMGRMDKSHYYMIPIKTLTDFIDTWHKKSANVKDLETHMEKYRVSIEDTVKIL